MHTYKPLLIFVGILVYTPYIRAWVIYVYTGNVLQYSTGVTGTYIQYGKHVRTTKPPDHDHRLTWRVV